MNMGNLIFLIVIIMIIKNAVRRKAADDSKRDSSAQRNLGQQIGSAQGLPRRDAYAASAKTAADSAYTAPAAAKTQPAREWNKSGSVRTTGEILKKKREMEARQGGLSGSSLSGSSLESSNSGGGLSSSAAKSGGAQAEASTTEYLKQKALEDAKLHREEKRQEDIRWNRETGGRMRGRRYLYGDSVPQGMRIVKCGYCGAENLISGRMAKEEYTCYFCREIL